MRDPREGDERGAPSDERPPSVESLFTEIDWITEDAVVGQRRGSADEPPAPWSIAEMVSTSVSSTKKTDDDDDDASGSAELVLRESVAGLRALWNVRLDDRVPLQYLTSTSHWRDLVLVVTPRPIHRGRRRRAWWTSSPTRSRASPALADPPWADLGTGSGALAIAVAKTLESMVTKPRATVHAVDVSPDARRGGARQRRASPTSPTSTRPRELERLLERPARLARRASRRTSARGSSRWTR